MSKEDERIMIQSILSRIEINVLKEKYSNCDELINELKNHINLMKNKYEKK